MDTVFSFIKDMKPSKNVTKLEKAMFWYYSSDVHLEMGTPMLKPYFFFKKKKSKKKAFRLIKKNKYESETSQENLDLSNICHDYKDIKLAQKYGSKYLELEKNISNISLDELKISSQLENLDNKVLDKIIPNIFSSLRSQDKKQNETLEEALYLDKINEVHLWNFSINNEYDIKNFRDIKLSIDFLNNNPYSGDNFETHKNILDIQIEYIKNLTVLDDNTTRIIRKYEDNSDYNYGDYTTELLVSKKMNEKHRKIFKETKAEIRNIKNKIDNQIEESIFASKGDINVLKKIDKKITYLKDRYYKAKEGYYDEFINNTHKNKDYKTLHSLSIGVENMTFVTREYVTNIVINNIDKNSGDYISNLKNISKYYEDLSDKNTSFSWNRRSNHFKERNGSSERIEGIIFSCYSKIYEKNKKKDEIPSKYWSKLGIKRERKSSNRGNNKYNKKQSVNAGISLTDAFKYFRLEKDSSYKDYKKVHRNLLKKYHPDKPNGNDIVIRKINAHAEVLTSHYQQSRV